MRQRWFLAGLFMVLAAPTVVPAQEVTPTVRVQIQSLNTVADNLKLLVSLAGKEDLANQIEGLIKSKIGNKGLEGIDM